MYIRLFVVVVIRFGGGEAPVFHVGLLLNARVTIILGSNLKPPASLIAIISKINHRKRWDTCEQISSR
jgi:hypothetical protein